MEFTRKDICEKTMLDPRTVLHYSERGVILPQIEETGGAGRYRRYSLWNLFEFFVLKELIGYGMHISNMRIVMTQLSDHFLQGPGGRQASRFNPKSIKPNTWLRILSYMVFIDVVEDFCDLSNQEVKSILLIDLYRIAQML